MEQRLKITSRARGQRGLAMVMALFVIAILLVVAMLLLDNAISATQNAGNLNQKNQIAAYAEAGMNAALDLLDTTPSTLTGTCKQFTSGAYSYEGCVQINAIIAASAVSSTGCAGSGTSTLSVPPGYALICGDANYAGARTVHVEALINAPTGSLTMPSGAINANQDVTGGGHMPVYADPTDLTHPNDATVHANRNVTSFTTLVQGLTYAASTDSQLGSDGLTHSSSSPSQFPSAAAVAAMASYAKSQAQNGTSLTAGQFTANGTQSYTGNVYINGNVDMTTGTATFLGGGTVYVNGDLCLSGHAAILNAAGTTFVVNGHFSSAGLSGGYTITPGTKGALIALGADTVPTCSAANGAYAANVSGNGTQSVGMIWAPNGSVQLAGNGTIIGAIVANVNAALNGGGSGGKFQYDSNLKSLTLNGGLQNARITAYSEY